MTREEIIKVAEELYEAWTTKKKVLPFTSVYPECTLDDAYQVQTYMLSHLVSNGYHISGRKMGYTNLEMQREMGLTGPSHGYLLSERKINSGDAIRKDDFIQPGIETEILFTIGKDLNRGNYIIEEIIDSIECMRVAMEIVDMRQMRINKTQRDSIGDEGAFGAYVVNDKKLNVSAIDLSKVKSRLYINDVVSCEGIGANVMNNPINSLLWAANSLAGKEDFLKSGEEFLSGSFTSLAPVNSGDRFRAEFEGLGEVAVTFV